MATHYAQDVSILRGPGGSMGLDSTGAPIYDLDCLVEDALKRQITDPGATWWAPAATINLRALLESSLSAAELRAVERRVLAVFAEDPRASYAVSLAKSDTAVTSIVTIAPVGGAPFIAVYTFNADGSYGVSVQR